MEVTTKIPAPTTTSLLCKTRNYFLNEKKQTQQKINQFHSKTILDTSSFKFSVSRTSAIIKDVNSQDLFHLKTTMQNFYSADDYVSPLCPTHNSFSYRYKYKEPCDKSSRVVELNLFIERLISDRYQKLGTMHVFLTSNSIQIRGSPENIELFIQNIVSPIFSAASKHVSPSIKNFSCISCYSNSIPMEISSGQREIAAPAHQSQKSEYSMMPACNQLKSLQMTADFPVLNLTNTTQTTRFPLDLELPSEFLVKSQNSNGQLLCIENTPVDEHQFETPTQFPVVCTPPTPSSLSAISTSHVITSLPVISTPTSSPVICTHTSLSVISSPTSLPVISIPTSLPVISSTTSLPVISIPTSSPVISNPTNLPVISTTSLPVFSTPTSLPVISTPTSLPAISITTSSPVSSTPTSLPVISTPTSLPVINTPTSLPVISTPISLPIISAPTSLPVIRAPQIQAGLNPNSTAFIPHPKNFSPTSQFQAIIDHINKLEDQFVQLKTDQHTTDFNTKNLENKVEDFLSKNKVCNCSSTIAELKSENQTIKEKLKKAEDQIASFSRKNITCGSDIDSKIRLLQSQIIALEPPPHSISLLNDKIKIIEAQILSLQPPTPPPVPTGIQASNVVFVDSPQDSPSVDKTITPQLKLPVNSITALQRNPATKRSNQVCVKPLMSIKDFPALKDLHLPHSPNNGKSDCIVGDSNLANILPIIQNRSRSLKAYGKSGATFFSMRDTILNEVPTCKTLIIQGGSNDAALRNNVSDCVNDLRNLIHSAKRKADQIILVPPPPSTPAMIEMESLMCQEATKSNIYCVMLSHLFPTTGPRTFRDNLHCTKLGSGIYGLAVINHLIPWTNLIRNPSEVSCVKCHHSGHTAYHCQPISRHQPPNTRFHMPVPTRNRFHHINEISI